MAAALVCRPLPFPSVPLPSKSSELKQLLLLFLPQRCHPPKPIHARALRLGLIQDSHLIYHLLASYFDAGHPSHACLLFHAADHPRNIFHWNAMIRGLVSVDQTEDAVQFYATMRRWGPSPDNFTFPFVLKACARLQFLEGGTKIHAHVIKTGHQVDVFVKTSLVSFYAKCGLLNTAHKLFEDMPVRNVVSWTSIISGYIGGGKLEEALNMFRSSLDMGLVPDGFTLVRILTTCSHLGDMETGEWIHRYAEDKGIDNNVFVATSLVSMYAKCGSMEKARAVFDKMVVKDVVSWSAMICGYSSNGLPREALELFFKMQNTNVRPDCYTMVGVLSACARLGALELGQQASQLMDASDFLMNPVLGTALIDMYAKCGSIVRAWSIFKRIMEKDLIVWNAMISGLAMTGHGNLSFGLFAQTEKLGIQPDGNTFIGLLCSCSHTGLVEDGRRYFDSISRVYCLTPRVEHYGCIIDLFCRAGLLNEAYQLINEMPMEANAVVWGAMLGGCKLHRDTKLAEHVLKKLIELEPQNSGNYVLLSNIYSTTERWNDSARLRLVMKEKGIQKTPGCSWVELKGVVHEFHVGDISHPLSNEIYSKLDELGRKLKQRGYMPTTEVVLFDIEEEEKEHSLGHHSEKLAIAFGLISMGPEDTIRVVKNLRVCNDCHAAIKLISDITNREIVVRDNNRFHCFKDGSCSCNDYW
ncbi:putative pentatricopeptide repeat-containing protein At3g08820 [Musa acuminata AAA Group]|uniref:putative pentatricopeptide repeat-containing protein At3g08820 n=1 Tax=Musa acuminata AAA Group TaxID=214697 RepID=UPI0031E19BCA